MVKADYFALAAHGTSEPSPSSLIPLTAEAFHLTVPLVVNAWKADVIGTLIRLKGEIEREPNATAPLRWVIVRCTGASPLLVEHADFFLF
jgi:hypothetical protein